MAHHRQRALLSQWLRLRCQRWAILLSRTIDPIPHLAFGNTQRARIPATLTAKSKPDLELYALELLKKLRARDKKIEGVLPRGIGRQDASCMGPSIPR